MEQHSKLDNGSVLFQRPDSFGRFGKFGGKYVPETLMHALSELEAAFHALAADEDFQVFVVIVDLKFKYHLFDFWVLLISFIGFSFRWFSLAM